MIVQCKTSKNSVPFTGQWACIKHNIDISGWFIAGLFRAGELYSIFMIWLILNREMWLWTASANSRCAWKTYLQYSHDQLIFCVGITIFVLLLSITNRFAGKHDLLPSLKLNYWMFWWSHVIMIVFKNSIHCQFLFYPIQSFSALLSVEVMILWNTMFFMIWQVKIHWFYSFTRWVMRWDTLNSGSKLAIWILWLFYSIEIKKWLMKWCT